MSAAEGVCATVGDLTENEFQAQLAAPGLGVRIGPFNAHLRAEARHLAQPLYRLYRGYPLLDDDNVFSFHVRLQEKLQVPRLYRSVVRFSVDGRAPHEDMPAAQALPVLEWGLNLVIALRSHCYLMLHSAVLERYGKALLLPASPGHGKTTLCAGLAHRGWRLLSDEFGLIRPDSADLIPVPRPMALKNESIDVIRSFASEAEIGPSIANTRKGTVAHVKPTAASVAKASEPATASWIVFPRWIAGARYALEEIPRTDGFMLLATNAFNYELLGEAAFRTVHQLVDGARCFRLLYSDLGEAVANLEQLAESDDR